MTCLGPCPSTMDCCSNIYGIVGSRKDGGEGGLSGEESEFSNETRKLIFKDNCKYFE